MIAGEKAPHFTLCDHTGRPRRLSALLSDGPVVLFLFPIASSPICTAQACHFRDLSNEFARVGAHRREPAVEGEGVRRGRHTRRRGLLARLLPVRRTTFVIDTDRTVLKVVSSEVRASVHADQTLWFLKNHKVPHSSPHVREKHTDAHQQSEDEGEPT